MSVKVNVGQIVEAEHYRDIKNRADKHYNDIASTHHGSTNHYDNAYRPSYNYNFAALKASIGEVITAWKVNELSDRIDFMIKHDCLCDCNYCTCNCNYCTCNCNYCTCNCNHSCVCHCAY